MKGVLYRDIRLMPGSHAHTLYLAGEHKKLDQHLKDLDAKELQLQGCRVPNWKIGDLDARNAVDQEGEGALH